MLCHNRQSLHFLLTRVGFIITRLRLLLGKCARFGQGRASPHFFSPSLYCSWLLNNRWISTLKIFVCRCQELCSFHGMPTCSHKGAQASHTRFTVLWWQWLGEEEEKRNVGVSRAGLRKRPLACSRHASFPGLATQYPGSSIERVEWCSLRQAKRDSTVD